jgi:Arc/MetJ-type ribon-helix-helix transcriptional regulator
VKTETLQTSVPREMAEFVRQDIAEGHFANANEYLRALIRQRRQSRIDEDVRLLEQAMAGAPAEDASPEFYGRVKELQSQFRQAKKPPRR